MNPETIVMSQIRKGLEANGYIVFRANVGSFKKSNGGYFHTGLPKGFPDLFGFRPDGKIFFIEVKTNTGKLSKEQKEFLEMANSRGAIAGMCTNLEQALKLVSA